MVVADATTIMADIINYIRPKHLSSLAESITRFTNFISHIEQNSIALRNVQLATFTLLQHYNVDPVLTESGIPLAGNFWRELSGRVKHKFLPPLQNKQDFLFLINSIFFKTTDYNWVDRFPTQVWIDFFEHIAPTQLLGTTAISHSLLKSLVKLSFQVAQLGIEKEIASFIQQQHKGNNPFTAQLYLIHELETESTQQGAIKFSPQCYAALLSEVQACEALLESLQSSHSSRGTSLHESYIILILANKIRRIKLIVDALDNNNTFSTQAFVTFFKEIVRNENRKNSVREFLSQTTGYLAYQIAEHKGAKGLAYITSNRKEYISMIKSAMWGGFIICFVVVIKNVLSKVPFAAFWQGFWYSINYAMGFCVIELTGATLATKQPAFTASAVASTLELGHKEQVADMGSLTHTVARVVRSQFASFFGNLIIVFPVSYLFAWVYDLIIGRKMVEGDEALKMLNDLHPFHSMSLLYACNTGVFLFLSGIIAGIVQNKIKYGHIYERLIAHPALVRTLSESRRNTIAYWVTKNSGALIGSIALGFFLGMAGIVGKILGIPFDIRHITIAAGNMSIGTYGSPAGQLTLGYYLTILLGVIGIGFMNFLISFSLAFIVAIKSRGIHLNQYPLFFKALSKYFFKHPLAFIIPPKNES